MTKAELINEYNELCKEKGITIAEIYSNSKKSEIQFAIDCLKCSDEEMNDYLIVFKLKFPNTYETIMKTGNWLEHRFNRIYVYQTVKMILGIN